MPRLRVIILDQTREDASTYNVVLWADVPSARQSFYANAAAQSAWSGATTTDNQALQSGAVVELAQTQRVPPGTPLAQLEQFMQNQWQIFQTFITNNNPW